MNVGIIGAGGIAQKMHLPQIEVTKGMTCVALADRNEQRTRSLAERFGVPNIYSDYHALLNDDSIEGVIVSVPHPLHVPVGLDVLKAGKHLLMQKPLCADMGEANAFVEAADASGKVVMCLPHFAPAVYKFRELIGQGAVGKVSGAHCRVSHGGPEVYYSEVLDGFGETGGELWFFKKTEASVGALFDMGVYAVSSLVALMGTVESVMGELSTVDKPTELEDTASLILRFANGAVGTAETGWCDPGKTWDTRIHGTKGKLTGSGVDGAILTHWEPGSYTREDTPATLTPVEAKDERGNAHQHWLACVQAGRQPELSNAHSARHVTEILLAGMESSRTGQRIKLTTKASA